MNHHLTKITELKLELSKKNLDISTASQATEREIVKLSTKIDLLKKEELVESKFKAENLYDDTHAKITKLELRKKNLDIILKKHELGIKNVMIVSSLVSKKIKFLKLNLLREENTLQNDNLKLDDLVKENILTIPNIKDDCDKITNLSDENKNLITLSLNLLVSATKLLVGHL